MKAVCRRTSCHRRQAYLAVDALNSYLLCKISRLTDGRPSEATISGELGSTGFVGVGAGAFFGFIVLVFMCSLPALPVAGLPVAGLGSRRMDPHLFFCGCTPTSWTTWTRVSRVTELLRFGESLACPMWPAKWEMLSITRTARVTPAMVQELCFNCDRAAPSHAPQELLLQWYETQV